MFKKSWHYLMIATMVLGALGPLSSVAAAEMTAQPDSEQAATHTSEDTTETAAKDADSASSTVSSTDTPASDESSSEEDKVEPPAQTEESKTPDSTSPDPSPSETNPQDSATENETESEPSDTNQTETMTPNTTPGVNVATEPEDETEPEPDAKVQAAEADKEEEEKEEEKKETKATVVHNVDTHPVIMFGNETANHNHTATASISNDDDTDKVTWSTNVKAGTATGNASLVLTHPTGSAAKTELGYYASIDKFGSKHVNFSTDLAGMHIEQVNARVGESSATADVVVGGLRAVTKSHAALLDQGLQHTIEAASSLPTLPDGQLWKYEWKAMRTNKAGNTTNDFPGWTSLSGVQNATGTIASKDVSDAAFMVNIAPTSPFIEYIVETYRGNNPQDFSLQLVVTAVDGNGNNASPALQYRSNYAKIRATDLIPVGKLELQQVPNMSQRLSFATDDLYAHKTDYDQMTGNLVVADSRINDNDGNGSTEEFERWTLSAKAGHFTNTTDQSELPFTLGLFERERGRLDGTLETGAAPITMLKGNRTLKSFEGALDLTLTPKVAADHHITLGDYDSTITWELAPSTKSDSL